MLISHKYKIIFIKTIKIAGSSFEQALARYCGADDIITPLGVSYKTDKQKKIRYGYSEGQNYTAPYEYKIHHNKIVSIKLLVLSLLNTSWSYNIRHNKIISMKPDAFSQHYSAANIKKYLPKEIWDSYLKVSIIRCPYDTLISLYYWQYRSSARGCDSFEKYAIDSGINQVLINYRKLHIGKKLATDFVIKFENLDEDIKKLECLIDCNGLLDTFKNIRLKSDARPNAEKASTVKVYSEYPTVKEKLDEALSEKFNQYELLQKYWQFYKSKLEEDLHRSHVITKNP